MTGGARRAYVPCELLCRRLANTVSPSESIFFRPRRVRVVAYDSPLRHDGWCGFRPGKVADRVRLFICVTAGVSDARARLDAILKQAEPGHSTAPSSENARKKAKLLGDEDKSKLDEQLFDTAEAHAERKLGRLTILIAWWHLQRCHALPAQSRMGLRNDFLPAVDTCSRCRRSRWR